MWLIQARIEEAVFLQSYIPTSLNEISNPLAEMARLQQGLREPVYEATVRGMLAGGLVGGNDTAAADSLEATASSKKMKKEGRKKDSDAWASLGGSKGSSTPSHVFLSPSFDHDNGMTEGVEHTTATASSSSSSKVVVSVIEGEQPEVDEDSDNDDSDDSSGSSGDSDDDDDASEDGLEPGEKRERKRSDKYRRQLPGHDDPILRLAEKEARKEAKKKSKEEAAKKRTEKIPKHVKKRAMKAGKKK